MTKTSVKISKKSWPATRSQGIRRSGISAGLQRRIPAERKKQPVTGFIEAIFAAHGPLDLSLSPVTVAELVHGIYRAQTREASQRRREYIEELLSLVPVHPIASRTARPRRAAGNTGRHPNCIAKGATTVVDAGSAGAHTFPGFRKMVLSSAETRVFALLNIGLIGQSTVSEDNEWGELLELHHVNTKLAIRTIDRNRDVIFRVKVRLSRSTAGANDLAALRLAREAADAVNLPLMIHIGDTVTPLTTSLREMKKGDVITHSFHGRPQGILDDRG